MEGLKGILFLQYGNIKLDLSNIDKEKGDEPQCKEELGKKEIAGIIISN